MTNLIRRLGAPVDYVKMDVEGAERALLGQSEGWVGAVRCLKVEVHQPYTVTECVRDLERVGLVCEVFRPHWACVIARNPRLL
jgi:hypothetical protein